MPVARSLAVWMSVAPLVAIPMRQPCLRSSSRPARTSVGQDTMAAMSAQYDRHKSSAVLVSRYRVRISSKLDG
jgi:hypothetical protein